MLDWPQFVYLALLIAIGYFILFLRRKAQGSRSAYKLALLLLGALIAISGGSKWFDMSFIEATSMVLMIVLMLELSIRLNPENPVLTGKNLWIFFGILAANIIVMSIISVTLIKMLPIYGIIIALILSSAEYFMVDELRSEGDLGNPLILLFTFSILYFYNLDGLLLDNIGTFFQHMIMGIGTGVIAGIIVFKSLKHDRIGWFHEVGLLCAGVATYIITERVGGSGLFAILVLGMFFGNSFVRKRADMKSFSPFIFKSLEMLIFLMLGFVIGIKVDTATMIKALIVFVLYILVRLAIMTISYKHYSFSNRLLLSFAPKGMVFASAIVVIAVYDALPSSALGIMLLVLIYSLVAGTIIEYVEEQKMARLERMLAKLSIRYGRKRDLKLSLFRIFRWRNRQH